MSESQEPKQNLTTYLLVGLLVAAAFFIGKMYTELQTVKGGAVGGVKNNAPAKAAAPADDRQAPTVDADSVPAVADQDHIRGNKNADITLIEYSDFECPYCARFKPTTDKVLEQYDGKVRLIFRNFPLSFHASAQMLAEGSECAAELGGEDAFWAYHDKVFDDGITEEADLIAAAPEIGVDGAALKTCIDSGKFTDKVKSDMAGGQAAGISGTPGTILLTKDGQTELISGALPYAQIKVVLDKYVK